jgi:hypothetical protein
VKTLADITRGEVVEVDGAGLIRVTGTDKGWSVIWTRPVVDGRDGELKPMDATTPVRRVVGR